MKIKYSIFLVFLACFSSFAQVYGGIEIGSKGVKMSIIEVENLKRNTYDVKKFWTENVGIARGISTDGILFKEDIDNAGAVVLSNFKKMMSEHNVPEANIFIVASSGVGMASNTDELAQLVKKLTNKKMDIISSSLEAKLLLRGCIPPKNHLNSVIIDIGGGNTKGGYAKEINDSNIFFPIAMDLGTVTLTELINKKSYSNTVFGFNEVLFDYLPTLRSSFNKMYNTRAESLDKQNIYISGGAAWAFFTIFTGQEATENFTKVTYEDVITTKAFIENNYRKIEELAETNKEIAKVIKVYQQKSLISAINLLATSLEVVPSMEKKKIYFAKQGQIAWLITYMFESAKGAKVVF